MNEIYYDVGQECHPVNVAGSNHNDWWTDGLSVVPFVKFPVRNGRMPKTVETLVLKASYSPMRDMEYQADIRPLEYPIRVTEPGLPGWSATISHYELEEVVQAEEDPKRPNLAVVTTLTLLAWAMVVAAILGAKWMFRSM